MTSKTVFFSGKGGVGKSTLSAAYAAFLSRSQRALHVDLSLEPQWTRSYEPVEIAPRLFACSLTRTKCLHEYMKRRLKVKALVDILLEKTPISTFFDAAPGVEGIVFMGKLFDLAMRGDFEAIIVDAPATGHGLGLFQTTEVVRQLFRVGPLHDDAVKVESWTMSPAVEVQLVTLFEELPIQETLEFYEDLKKLGLRVSGMEINRVPRKLPWPVPSAVLEKLKTLGNSPPIEKFLIDELSSIKRYLRTLRGLESKIKIQTLELCENVPTDLPSLGVLWENLRGLPHDE